MKNILFLRQIRPNPTQRITKFAVAFFLFASLFYVDLKAQEYVSSDTKKILFLSCVFDEVSLNSYSVNRLFDHIVLNADSNYKNFEYVCSDKHTLHFSNNENIKHDRYSVQLYKVPREHIPYYVLKFESASSVHYTFSDTLWIRVSGYAYNDLKVFFDRLKEKGMSIEKIRSMVNTWQNIDGLFNEIDWKCLLDGYEINDTRRDCYVSYIYASHNAACKGCHHEVSGDVYAIYSKIILYGHIDFDL